MSLKIQTTGLEQYAPGGNARIKVLVIGGPGAGKRLHVDTRVATPSGWRRFGDLVAGDEVMGADGTPTTVLGIHGEGTGPAYRVATSDGCSVIADGAHLWAVQTRKDRSKGRAPRILSTHDMTERGVRGTPREGRKARYEFYLPIAQEAQYPTADLPVEPYLVGALLANGSVTSGLPNFVTPHPEMAERVLANNSRGLRIEERSDDDSTFRRWCVFSFRPALDELGFGDLEGEDKFIPDQYLTAGTEQRWELLRGLMDGNGSCLSGKRARYHTRSHRLAYDVRELVHSLGGVARVSSAPRTAPNGGRYAEHNVSVWTPRNPFTIEAKRSRYYCPRDGFRAIESIEPVGEAPMRCIQVDAPDELYVVQHYIVTHNTRWASYFPKPFYADVEAGLASVADRQVPFASVRNSNDMLDVLEFLKVEQRQPWEQRKYQTVIIDTLDAFQRKVKNEWMEKENSQTFSGWDAWGFLNAKMGLLMTRLLNLDMNVIVNVHYKDKTIKDDETGRESREIVLQLQGEMSDTAFNDFDLVGWMGTYWEAVEGQKVQKRGLTFKPTSDKPFLKDRLYVTPTWMEVEFADSDYTKLFSAITERIDEFEPTEDIGEVPTADGEVTPPTGVLSPAAAGAGPVAPQQPAPDRLGDYDKATLQAEARKRSIAFKGNTLKGELIALIEAHDQKKAGATQEPAKNDSPPPPPAPPEPPEAAVITEPPARLLAVEEGLVDPLSGELAEPVSYTADPPATPDSISTVKNILGGQVINETPAPTPPAATPEVTQQKPPVVKGNCDDCSRDLAGESPDVVKLSRIKFKAPKPNPVVTGLCGECYAARKITG